MILNYLSCGNIHDAVNCLKFCNDSSSIDHICKVDNSVGDITFTLTLHMFNIETKLAASRSHNADHIGNILVKNAKSCAAASFTGNVGEVYAVLDVAVFKEVDKLTDKKEKELFEI